MSKTPIGECVNLCRFGVSPPQADPPRSTLRQKTADVTLAIGLRPEVGPLILIYHVVNHLIISMEIVGQI